MSEQNNAQLSAAPLVPQLKTAIQSYKTATVWTTLLFQGRWLASVTKTSSAVMWALLWSVTPVNSMWFQFSDIL